MSATETSFEWPTREELHGIFEGFQKACEEIDVLTNRFGRILRADSVEYEAEGVLELPAVPDELIAEMVRFLDRIDVDLSSVNGWALEMKAWPARLAEIQDEQAFYSAKGRPDAS